VYNNRNLEFWDCDLYLIVIGHSLILPKATNSIG
jgi:hypothetical protein